MYLHDWDKGDLEKETHARVYSDPTNCATNKQSDIDATADMDDDDDDDNDNDTATNNRRLTRQHSTVCQRLWEIASTDGRERRMSTPLSRHDRDAGLDTISILPISRSALTSHVDTSCRDQYTCICLRFRVVHAALALVYVAHMAVMITLGYVPDERDSTGFPVYVTTLGDQIQTFHRGPAHRVAQTELVAVIDCLAVLGILALVNFVWFSALCMSSTLWRRYTDSIDNGSAFHRIYIDFVCSSTLTFTVMLSSGVCLVDTLVLSCALVISASVLVVYRTSGTATSVPTRTTVTVVALIHFIPICIGLYVIGLEGNTPIRYCIVALRSVYIAWMCFCIRRGPTLTTALRVADIPLRTAVTLGISWLVFTSHYQM